MRSGFVVSLSSPVAEADLDAVAKRLQASTGGDVDRIRALLSRAGDLAKFSSRESAEEFVSLLQELGVSARVKGGDVEMEWGTPAASPAPSQAPAPANGSGASRGGAALGGAALCLGFGGLVAFYAPVMLVVFAPLFVAAFALSIVAIAQGRTLLGIVVLVLTMVVGPVMTVGGVARTFWSAASEASRGSTSSTLIPSPGRAAGEPTASSAAAPVAEPSPTPHGIGEGYDDSVEIYEFEARRISSFLEDNVPAVRFKVRNNGERTITRLRITVFFRDSDDRVVFEHELSVVAPLTFSSDIPESLKPGYIFQMPAGRYFTIRNVPDEWQEGNAILQVTRLEVE